MWLRCPPETEVLEVQGYRRSSVVPVPMLLAGPRTHLTQADGAVVVPRIMVTDILEVFEEKSPKF